MHKYLVTSTTSTPPRLHLASKLLFTSMLEIVAHGLHVTSPHGTLALALNIIVAMKFGSLPQIQFTLDKLSLGIPKNLPFQLPPPLT